MKFYQDSKKQEEIDNDPLVCVYDDYLDGDRYTLSGHCHLSTECSIYGIDVTPEMIDRVKAREQVFLDSHAYVVLSENSIFFKKD